jgi:hypothetical protein
MLSEPILALIPGPLRQLILTDQPALMHSTS